MVVVVVVMSGPYRWGPKFGEVGPPDYLLAAKIAALLAGNVLLVDSLAWRPGGRAARQPAGAGSFYA